MKSTNFSSRNKRNVLPSFKQSILIFLAALFMNLMTGYLAIAQKRGTVIIKGAPNINNPGMPSMELIKQIEDLFPIKKNAITIIGTSTGTSMDFGIKLRNMLLKAGYPNISFQTGNFKPVPGKGITFYKADGTYNLYVNLD